MPLVNRSINNVLIKDTASEITTLWRYECIIIITSMAEIQSATAEIRRGKKKIDRQKKPQGNNINSMWMRHLSLDVNISTISQTNGYGRRDFSVVGPRVWNSLPDFIRHPAYRCRLFQTCPQKVCVLLILTR